MAVLAPPLRRTPWSRWRCWLARPVDSSMLAAFRLSFGAVVAWELWRYERLGRPERYYLEPQVLFTYWPFDWVRPLPDAAMSAVFPALTAVALMVAAGLFTRITASVLAVGLGYVFLLDRTHYLNHWYLMVLLAGILAVTPSGATCSLDAWRRPDRDGRTVPGWALDLVRFQLAVVYVYGGLAKLDPEWLAGRPLTMWLAGDGDVPLIGRWLVLDGAGVGLAWASAAFDLAIVPLLCWRPTRRFAYVVAVAFHLLNSRLFTIGVFPWAMLLATAVFFPADLPRRMWSDLRAGRHIGPSAVGAGLVAIVAVTLPRRPELATGVVGALAGAVAGYNLVADPPDRPAPPAVPTATPAVDAAADVAGGPHPRVSRFVAALLAGWVLVQLLVPLRHHLYPGDPSWTEEGHRFSWRMMLRSKEGIVEFVVTDPRTGESVVPDLPQLLTPAQLEELPNDPDLIVQFARWLEVELGPRFGNDDLEVRARSEVSFNGRTPAPLVDPDVDLTEVDRPWRPPAPWIEPRPPLDADGG
jgi:vitamin K-dependent gamma-carboxylase